MPKMELYIDFIEGIEIVDYNISDEIWDQLSIEEIWEKIDNQVKAYCKLRLGKECNPKDYLYQVVTIGRRLRYRPDRLVLEHILRLNEK